MKLLKKRKGSKDCMIYAFAMALDLTPEGVCDILGHDPYGQVQIGGTSIPRSFHPQDLIGYCQCIRFDRQVQITRHGQVFRTSDYSDVFSGLVMSKRGVITGRGASGGHAVAFETGQLYCPDHGISSYQAGQPIQEHGFTPDTLWII